MNRNFRGIVFYLAAILVIFLLVTTFRDRLEASQAWNNSQLEEALEKGKVVKVAITQNREVPTGVLRVTTTSGEVKSVNVTDVRAVQELLKAYPSVSMEVSDVTRDSVFLTSILPILLICLLMFFVFSMMNRQAGGSNARMMNFGKSRARLMSMAAGRVTF